MDGGLIGKPASRANPDMKAAILDFLAEITIEFDGPPLYRPFAFVIAPHRVRHQRQHARFDVGLVRQLLRRRHIWYRGLVAHPGLVAVERHRHGEYRLAVLDRHDPTGGEALAVADAVDLIN